MKITKELVHKGNLILVNDEYPLKKDVENDLVQATENIILNRTVYVNVEKIKEELGMEEDVLYVSGYRTHDYQKALYENTLKEFGQEYTEKFVAKVDCSEHQTGLAVDLGENVDNVDYICPKLPYDGKFAEFRDKLCEYGFIERYQQDKKDITKIAAEPWHFRFVGYPHSLIMKELGMCLEEYIIYLKDYSEDKVLRYRNCEIFYVKQDEEVKLEGCFWISGNNVDGCIVTKVVG